MTDCNRSISFLPFSASPPPPLPCVMGRQSPVATHQEPAAAPMAPAPATDAPQDESMGITAFALFDYQAGEWW